MSLSKKLMILSAPLVLAACGGGGGGGGAGSSSTLAPFVKWSSVAAGSTYVISGDSMQGTYTWNSGTDRITAITRGAQQTGATFTETFNSNGIVQSVRIQTASGTDISFARGTDTFGVLLINNDINAVISADQTRYALAPEPTRMGWEYQSFGIWVTGAGTGSGTYGAASVGVATAGSSVPTTGTATFTGYTGGRAVANDGSYVFTSSNMSAVTNFATRSIAFTTSNTATTADLLRQSSVSSLNMSGTLTYSAGSNQFTGNVSTTGGMTGTATGRFYGPTAQEIGGTFGVTGAGVLTYGGAFGGKR
jgi:hypothetical protein